MTLGLSSERVPVSNNKPPRKNNLSTRKKAEKYLKCAESKLEKMALTFVFLILLSTPAVFCAETCGSEAQGKYLILKQKHTNYDLPGVRNFTAER